VSPRSIRRPVEPMKIAILDDYQNVALRMADWSALAGRAEITVFNDHLAAPGALVERLVPFDVICVMRERTPLPREVLQRLPHLKLIASTGARNASIDVSAAKKQAEKYVRGISAVWPTPPWLVAGWGCQDPSVPSKLCSDLWC